MTSLERPSVTVRGAHVRYRVNEDRERGIKELFARGRVRTRSREVHAVRGVDLDVYEGETLGIVGTNGSGKSTLMSAMTGLLPLSEGEIHVKARPTLLGVSAALRPALSGRRNILIGGLALGLSLEEITERSDEIAEFAGLEEFIDLPMRTYSSGMRARLNFSIATARIPEILLIDEALAVGDEQFRRRSKERLDEIRANAGSVILVSHNLNEIETTCDRVIWLEKGELRMTGEPQAVVAAYLADLDPHAPSPEPDDPSAADGHEGDEPGDDADERPAAHVRAEPAPDDAVPDETLVEDDPGLGRRTAYVHIGLTNTGAPTFQRVVAANHQRLAEAGFVVPRFLGQTNHTTLAAYASVDAAAVLGLAEGSDYDEWRATFRSDFIEATQVPGDLVVSSELIGVGLRPAHIRALPELLRAAGYERIEVLMVVRPQHEMAAIDHLTQVRNGRSAPFDLDEHLGWRRRYDFEMIAGRWEALQGVEAIHPVLYPTRDGMEEPAAAMLRLIGAGDVAELADLRDDDRLGIGPAAIEYLRALNERVDPADLPIPAEVLRSLGATGRPRLADDDARRLMDAFAEANHSFLERLDPAARVDGYFDPPASAASGEAEVVDSDAVVAAMVAYAADQRRRVRQQARDLG